MAGAILGWEVLEDPDRENIDQHQEEERQIMDFGFQIRDSRLHRCYAGFNGG